jgi:outer membrane phospholipase A
VQPTPLNAKYQISFAVRVVGDPKIPHGLPERRDGLYFSYSQTSFWDLHDDSSPFIDNSYRPELWWHQGGMPNLLLDTSELDLEGGFGHESNGTEGSQKVAMNFVFVRPVARWDVDDIWRVHVEPRLRQFVGSLNYNPDIARYRGLFSLYADVGRHDGLKVSGTAVIGSLMTRGSWQMDLSYPLVGITHGWVNVYVYGQWFDGFAEDLRLYHQRSDRFLLGLAFVP